MQKRIIRIMTNSGFRDPSLSLFAKLNILQVDDVIKLEVAKLMHSVLGNDKPQFKKLKSFNSIELLFTPETHQNR